jgi:hypothetical protein
MDKRREVPMPRPSPHTVFAVLFLAVPAAAPLAFSAEVAKPKESCAVFVSIGPRTLESSDRKSLRAEMARLTGHSAEAEVMTKNRSPYAEALARRANILVTLNRSPGEDQDFIVAVATDVGTESILGDTAVGAGKGNGSRVQALAVWYRDTAEAAGACPPFDLEKALDRLVKADRCQDVIDAVPDHDRAGPCRDRLMAVQAARAPVARQLLNVKLEGVPPGLGATFTNAADDSNVDEAVHDVTYQLSQLIVTCTSDCAQGRILLRIPFSASLYRARLEGSKDPLAPYHEVAKAVLHAREEAVEHAPEARRAVLRAMNVELVLVDPSGAELRIDVRGSKMKPSLKPRSSPAEFFGTN